MKLDVGVERALTAELKNTRISDIERYLYDIQVVINFMLTSFNKIDTPIQAHMAEVFPEGKGLIAHRYIKDDIKLCHIKHVWMLLKYAQADHLLRDQIQVLWNTP